MTTQGKVAALKRLSPEDLRALSLRHEAETGCDSIATVERAYDRSPAGAILCPWPTCAFRRRDPVLVWLHAHSHRGRDDLPEPPAGDDHGDA